MKPANKPSNCSPITTEKEALNMLQTWKKNESKFIIDSMKSLGDNEIEELLDAVMPLTDAPMEYQDTRSGKLKFIVSRIQEAIKNISKMNEDHRRQLTDILLNLYQRGVGCAITI